MASYCPGACAEEKSIDLIVTPNICVLSEHESTCNHQLKVIWIARDRQLRNVCLFQEEKTQALRCWVQVSGGETSIEAVLNQTTVYELRQTTDQTVIARQWVQVLRVQKRFSLRRNPWSFF